MKALASKTLALVGEWQQHVKRTQSSVASPLDVNVRAYEWVGKDESCGYVMLLLESTAVHASAARCRHALVIRAEDVAQSGHKLSEYKSGRRSAGWRWPKSWSGIQ